MTYKTVCVEKKPFLLNTTGSNKNIIRIQNRQDIHIKYNLAYVIHSQKMWNSTGLM